MGYRRMRWLGTGGAGLEVEVEVEETIVWVDVSVGC